MDRSGHELVNRSAAFGGEHVVDYIFDPCCPGQSEMAREASVRVHEVAGQSALGTEDAKESIFGRTFDIVEERCFGLDFVCSPGHGSDLEVRVCLCSDVCEVAIQSQLIGKGSEVEMRCVLGRRMSSSTGEKLPLPEQRRGSGTRCRKYARCCHCRSNGMTGHIDIRWPCRGRC
jgi:hypothetical protein